MSSRYRELAERIRGEVLDMDRIVQRIELAWEQAQRQPTEQAYLDSVALNLHGFYSGQERLFELIARQVDGISPEGETWHRDLLDQMAKDVAERRPAVIGQDTAQHLDEFRRFRHLVRNVYTLNLDPLRMAGLVLALPELWPRGRAEMLAFAAFLDALAAAGQSDRE